MKFLAFASLASLAAAAGNKTAPNTLDITDKGM